MREILDKYNIFLIIDEVCNLIISTFVDNLNIFVLYVSAIMSQIINELAAEFNKVDEEHLVFYVSLKV